MANYKGNPDLYKYGFKSDREKPCTAQVGLRVTPEMKEELKNIEGWRDMVRSYLEEVVASKSLIKP